MQWVIQRENKKCQADLVFLLLFWGQPVVFSVTKTELTPPVSMYLNFDAGISSQISVILSISDYLKVDVFSNCCCH